MNTDVRLNKIAESTNFDDQVMHLDKTSMVLISALSDIQDFYGNKDEILTSDLLKLPVKSRNSLLQNLVKLYLWIEEMKYLFDFEEVDFNLEKKREIEREYKYKCLGGN